MTVQIPLKKDSNRDAQRQGHVGFSDLVIYPGQDSSELSNGSRVKSIFLSEFTDLSSKEIALPFFKREQEQNQINNPDFEPSRVTNSYLYNKNVSTSIRSKDLHNIDDEAERKAPNVALPESSDYIAPFEGSGGFGNDAEENSLHSGGLTGSEGLLDSLEILEKYND